MADDFEKRFEDHSWNSEEREPTSVRQRSSGNVQTLHAITLRIQVMYDRNGCVENLINELNRRDPFLHCSILEKYVLEVTADPVDLSHMSTRSSYEPDLSICKNDQLGPWKFNPFFELISLDYSYDSDGQRNFPKIWKTDQQTRVEVQIKKRDNNQQKDSNDSPVSNNNKQTLKDLLEEICRRNNYDVDLAEQWDEQLKAEYIFTVKHLRKAVEDTRMWNNFGSVKTTVKQMIKDHLCLTDPSFKNSQSTKEYDMSDAMLRADIHRIRRYFHYVTKTLHLISYLDQEAVHLAIEQARKNYKDDGNVLNEIQSYLQTFSLKDSGLSRIISENAEKQPEKEKEKVQLKEDISSLAAELATSKRNYDTAKQLAARQESTTNSLEQTKRLQTIMDSYEKKQKLQQDKIAKIQHIEECVGMFDKETQEKLSIKYGRGLLLYGPPGTGKSALLKHTAHHAGITLLTTPLSAGELTRPYVGETERLLIDIMSRAKTVPYLICAVTIDEIDSLVPKRTQEVRESKADGISVLLSHIEGVNDIPNLILLGATNRKHMMDTAFLRRMQAKCFVGRPSPESRRNLFLPLTTVYSKLDSKLLSFLVKITTKFSGAAVVTLRNKIIVAVHENIDINDQVILDMANSTAHEHNCWLGNLTLPQICRDYLTIFSSQSTQHEGNQRQLSDAPYTGRILVDLHTKKCFFELKKNDMIEDALEDEETSLNPLLLRFLNISVSRNVDAIDVFDHNYLMKNGAFNEQRTSELLMESFEEFSQSSRSMFIFDIDSLIRIRDSDIAPQLSLGNEALYQIVRERCKTSIVDQQKNIEGKVIHREQWIVMIVKNPALRNLLLKDIDMAKTIVERIKDEEEHLAAAAQRTCPKCQQSYIPSDVDQKPCYYHDGYIVDLDQPNTIISLKEAHTILLHERLADMDETFTSAQLKKSGKAKLFWNCCFTHVNDNKPCQEGVCGPPDELNSAKALNDDELHVKVQTFFQKNPRIKENMAQFVQSKRQATNPRRN